MQEAAGVFERLVQLAAAFQGWKLEGRSFAEEAQRMEHFLDGARARIESLALQVGVSWAPLDRTWCS